MQQSIGQSSVINSYVANRYLLRQGFLQPLQLSGDRKNKKIKTLRAKISPNPFSTGVRVSFSVQLSGNVCCNLYNAYGKIVYSKTYPAAQDLNLDFGSIESGMYFITISNNNQQLTEKLIKQ